MPRPNVNVANDLDARRLDARNVDGFRRWLDIECVVDELAIEAGQDPLDFRCSLLRNSPEHAAVLRAVAESAGWKGPASPGRHRGLSHCIAPSSYTAACAEVSVTADDQFTIHRVTIATDRDGSGQPRQVNGPFTVSLSTLLQGELDIAEVAPSRLTIASAAPAVLNAIYFATGRRMRPLS